MLSHIQAHYAKCRYAECHYAECCSASQALLIGPSVPNSPIHEAKKVSRDNARVFVDGKRFQPSLTNALAYCKNSQITDK
jgi:hypothetical protein